MYRSRIAIVFELYGTWYQWKYKLTINVPGDYMGRYEVVLRGDYP